MQNRDPKLARSLEQMLEKECKLYLDYIELLDTERSWITKFNSDKLQAIRAKREVLFESMKEAHEARLAVMDKFPEGRTQKLRVIIRRYFTHDEAKRLLPVADKLRELILKTRKNGMEFNQVATYALNLVNGTLSILWSATQNVVKSYGPSGIIQESFNPSGSRSVGVLKQA